ncbi:uncharacterized protein LOC116811862 isoform X4 [Hylobates moloch]|uniref:uncharacterized protein LOC116811862 isoform X4 n=1 Tax=Hylobates moloch TaxID=81572 RepID=UPI002675F30A|nr:uncharacterized protein LOC116811862 isoform X4 [Hylobates moloch]
MQGPSPTPPPEKGECAARGSGSAKFPACSAAIPANTLARGAGTLARSVAAGTAVKCEVLCLLTARGDEAGRHGSTLKYISKTPCRHQSPEIVREFLTALKSHKLTKWWKRVKSGSQRSRLKLFSTPSPAFCPQSQRLSRRRIPTATWQWTKRTQHRRAQLAPAFHEVRRPGSRFLDVERIVYLILPSIPAGLASCLVGYITKIS